MYCLEETEFCDFDSSINLLFFFLNIHMVSCPNRELSLGPAFCTMLLHEAAKGDLLSVLALNQACHLVECDAISNFHLERQHA